MPRLKQPTNVLELKGAFKDNPQRKPEAEPQLEPIDPKLLPPLPGFTRIEMVALQEITKACHARTITECDIPVIYGLARLHARVVYSDELNIKDVGPWANLLGRLGMTPSDRSRIQTLGKEAPKANPLAEFGT